MDYIVHGVTKSRTCLSDFLFTSFSYLASTSLHSDCPRNVAELFTLCLRLCFLESQKTRH